ncbi:MAG TPA: PAS domain S-box protein [Candidatus Omnitrophota bacterium]|nr:PAS domain S-box protein [Candidatus Omnitrophota bacterium]HPD84613.1 PAS domain S-box protein [Candidatus Omnitrophota bacterium]HRZ03471.1 PAS domain S-box protein [Candidatus Omnitrophota bacterium]
MEKTILQRAKILLIDADAQEIRLLRKAFTSQKEYSISVKCVRTLQHGLGFLRRGKVDIIFAGLELPDSQGLNTTTRIHAQAADIPLVAILSVRFKTWPQVLKRGAQDYLFKEEIDAKLLARIVRANLKYKKMREELALAGLELQSIFKAFPDLFFRMSKDGAILAYGAGREDDLYVPPEEFLNRKMQDVLPAHVGRVFKKALHRVLKTKSPVGFEYFLTVSGEKKKFEARLLPLMKEEVIAVVRDISRPERLAERLEKINECFLNFGPDPIENINRLVASCGKMLNATCALYNHLKNDTLCSLGQWNAPKDYVPEDRPQGHICYDVIKSKKEGLVVIRDLMHSIYAKTDPNVSRYKLQTYVGKAVKFSGKNVGSLCVLYQKDFSPQEIDARTIGIIASAIGVEEERYRQDEAIKISEKRLRRITDNTLELITELDLNGKIVYHSPSMKSVLGYDPQAMVGTDLFPFIHPEDLENVKNTFKKIIAEGKGTSLFRARHIEGHYLWIEATGRLVTDGNRQPTGIVAGWRDVSARKKAEEALTESELKFRLVFENAADALVWADITTGTLIDCNRAAENLFERPRHEIIGRHQEMLHPPESRAPVKEAFKKQATGKEPPVEVPIITKSGRIKTVSIAAAVIDMGARKIMQGTFRDVTERKKIEETLRESEARHKTLIDNISSCVAVYEAKENGNDFIIRDFNKAAERTESVKKEDIIGRSIREVFPGVEEFGLLVTLKQVWQTGKPANHPSALYKDNRISGWRENYVYKLPSGEIVAVYEDVTARVRGEEALKKSEERYRRMVDAVTLYTYSVEVSAGRAVSTRHSEECLAVTGYSPEDYARRVNLWHEMIYPDDRKLVEKSIDRLLAGEEVFPIEHRIIRRDGEIIWIRNTHVPYRDEKGRIIRYDGLVENITERKRTEEALRESESRYRSTIDAMDDAIHVVDENLKLILMNQSCATWCQAYGGQKDPLGKKVFEVFPFLKDEVLKQYHSTFETGKAIVTEETNIVKGREFVTETRKVPILENRKTVRVVTIITDITERKKAEEALRVKAEFEKLLTNVSSRFINVSSEKMDEEINYALGAIGEFAGVDRSYIFIFKDDQKIMVNTHEWCRQGVVSSEQILQDIDVRQFPLFEQQIRKQETFYVPEVSAIPPQYANEKKFFQDQDVQSLIVVPMVYAGSLMGFLGFDSVRGPKEWSQDTVVLLKIVGGIFVNAMERKRTDEVLRANEAKLRQVIDLTPNFVFAKDIEGHFVIVNKAVADTYGTTVEELLGKKDSDFAKSEEEVHHFRKDDMEVIESGKRKFVPEEIITDSAGKVHILQTTKIPFRILGTNAPAVLGVSSDITELKEKEESLKTLSHAIEQSPSIVIITDTKGNIEYVNPRFAQITGYSLDEVFGKNPRLLKSNETPKLLYQQMWETIISGNVWRGEFPNKKKDGEIFWAQVGISSIKNEKNEIVHFLAVEQDVTERKKVEEELDDYRKHLEELVEERTRELRHSERLAATGRLAASIAHEINNPLQGIMTHLEIMHDSLPVHFEKMKNYEFVKNNIEKIKDIVMKLLDTYRGTDEGKTQVDINEIIKRVESLVEHQLGLRNIRLKLNLAQGIPRIEGWRQQLHQVFLNLVLNSQDSIKKDGQITITTSCGEEWISVQVSDTGEGIRPEDMDHLFQPFFTTKTDSGTGLGLFVSQGIIKEHNGSIKVKSEVGKGSIFTVVLPI